MIFFEGELFPLTRTDLFDLTRLVNDSDLNHESNQNQMILIES